MVIIGIVTGVVGVAGIIYTIHYGRRGQRKKLLVYEVSGSIALARAFSPESDYGISVLFQRKGSIEEKIESVYTTFLKFANLGREPILDRDVAPGNAIKVSVKGTRALDIQLAGITRDVNNVCLRDQVLEEDKASAYVDFDYLDYQDGGLIKILSVGEKGDISLEGDIIGMPEGIKNIDEIRPTAQATDISKVWLSACIVVGSLILSILVYYWITGNLTNVWLMFLPFGVLAIVMTIIMIIDDVRLWLRGRGSFPRSLDLPIWARPFSYTIEVVRERSMRSALLQMRVKITREARRVVREAEREENRKSEKK